RRPPIPIARQQSAASARTGCDDVSLFTTASHARQRSTGSDRIGIVARRYRAQIAWGTCPMIPPCLPRPRKRGTLRSVKAWIGASLLLAVLILAALLILFQRRFFYYPRKYSAGEIETAEKQGATVLGYETSQ